ncbi:MAG TPA: hypothetical protein VK168_12600 [Saprospiraceae bacterium]|nr:hypothetical protein [Saprospiraceae bacterium]
MESPANSIEILFDRIEVYGQTTLNLWKLQMLEASIKISTKIISNLSFALLISTSIFIFSIGLALYLGELLGKAYYGFTIIAISYLIAGVMLHFFLGKWLRKHIGDSIISEILH